MSIFAPGEEVICVDNRTDWPWKPCKFVKGNTYIVAEACACGWAAIEVCGYRGCWADNRFRRPIVDGSHSETKVTEDA